MGYQQGAQGVQVGAVIGPTGPQAWSPTQQIWGPQTPVAGKRAPFVGNTSNNLDVLHARLELRTTHRSGLKLAIVVERDISAETDLLTYFPDDLVQMVNILDFRPHTGYYYTTEGGSIRYRVIAVDSMVDPIGNLLSRTDDSEPIYIANETGL